MAAFQIRKIQSIIVFIIVLIAILWLFQDNIAKISVFQKNTQQFDTLKEEMKDIAYLEKIDNYLLKSDMMKPWAFKTVVQLSKPI